MLGGKQSFSRARAAAELLLAPYASLVSSSLPAACACYACRPDDLRSLPVRLILKEFVFFSPEDIHTAYTRHLSIARCELFNTNL